MLETFISKIFGAMLSLNFLFELWLTNMKGRTFLPSVVTLLIFHMIEILGHNFLVKWGKKCERTRRKINQVY